MLIVSVRRVQEEETPSMAAWISVLKLSLLWQMDRLQKLAIRRMKTLRDQASPAHYMTLFHMSARHQLSAGRKLASRELSKRLTAEMVLVLAQKYQARRLFLDACLDFVKKPAGYDFDDKQLAKLDTTTVVKLFRYREKYLSDNESIVDLWKNSEELWKAIEN
jgi:hypothetical protein